MGNEIITWESSRNLDFGIDFALFDNRLQTTFDWYCRTTSDILLNLEARVHWELNLLWKTLVKWRIKDGI